MGSLIDDFSGNNVDLLIFMIENIGYFLGRHPESKEKFNELKKQIGCLKE